MFWDEINDRDGRLTRNTPRLNKHQAGLIIKSRDVMENFGSVERKMVEGEHSDYDDSIRKRLRDVRDVLDKYRLSFIGLKGIEVSEVCEIFERINQEGKPLNIFDIVVAKTFRVQTEVQPGLYLREIIERYCNETPGNFVAIDDLTYLQIIAIIIRQQLPDDGDTLDSIGDIGVGASGADTRRRNGPLHRAAH